MNRVEKSSKGEKEKINQFIIECLFKKYFEENMNQEKVVIQKKEVSV